jgi:hypothetical protein
VRKSAEVWRRPFGNPTALPLDEPTNNLT